MIDIDLVVEALRRRGHTVHAVVPVPENAGEYELGVDGKLIPLEEARLLMEQDDARKAS